LGELIMAEQRGETPLLVAFLDLTRYVSQSQRVTDGEHADTLDACYECMAKAADGAAGRMVKFFGDGGLMVFEKRRVDRGVAALLELKESVDALMRERGWDCRLTVKAHFGTVVAGPFGVPGAKYYDVIGKAVNTAATLDGAGVTLSVEAFRKLGPELRKRFNPSSGSASRSTPPASPTSGTRIRAGFIDRPFGDVGRRREWLAAY
jgi:class 3 adenylate cyclase